MKKIYTIVLCLLMINSFIIAQDKAPARYEMMLELVSNGKKVQQKVSNLSYSFTRPAKQDATETVDAGTIDAYETPYYGDLFISVATNALSKELLSMLSGRDKDHAINGSITVVDKKNNNATRKFEFTNAGISISESLYETEYDAAYPQISVSIQTKSLKIDGIAIR